ncbi:unnamed protein product [Echinostoma caproni]|uniref:alanine transaminase n=1 Tax=Echinostoma caproni TaxID=27848 RepID=A0A183B2C7_9TREM|nr:unnamed protein product [Echinostoma caproni]
MKINFISKKDPSDITIFSLTTKFSPLTSPTLYCIIRFISFVFEKSHQIGYYLDEEHEWGLNVDQLEATLKEHSKNCFPRALVVINPGNPTGQVLPEKVIKRVLEFAHRHSLVVLADEVYQHNIYTPDRKFVSFKRALHDIGGAIAKEVQLASFIKHERCRKMVKGMCIEPLKGLFSFECTYLFNEHRIHFLDVFIFQHEETNLFL